MTRLASILLPVVAGMVRVERVPRLIVDALHPLPQGVCPLTLLRQRAACWAEHKSAVSATIGRGELVVRNPVGMLPQAGPWSSEPEKAVVAVQDLARYLERFGIGVKWLELPTELPDDQFNCNRSVPINWTEVATITHLPARDAVLLMHGLNPRMHRNLALPLSPEHSDDVARFFATVRDVLALAEAQKIAARQASEWLQWADDLEIVVHSDFRRLVESQRAWRGTSGASLAVSGGAPLTPARPLTVFHKNPHRKANILDAPVDLARCQALDPGDYQSVWASLVKIAQAPRRPAPLTGYVETEGILYQDENNPCKRLTKVGFAKYFSRRFQPLS
ncbi:hypothetical protein BN2475_90118 [Paraburkholderia ribeironis]|uniref:Uncharacterized protein n=1 Tax=Paraburkholderia ribeironis TaxID=1247936 RepID=A0A1N7RNA5_9BURK|nr:hypothetical protein [Paraburkholderia ribeironis]SIT36604.1 hypothetical protein BN2475_90118 [Paraburkholderia ribeironis]